MPAIQVSCSAAILRNSARPSFCGVIYAMRSMMDDAHSLRVIGTHPGASEREAYSVERHVGADTPPTFLAQAADDPVCPVENSLMMFAALRTALGAELSRHAQLAVCGDFNVAPTDDDVWDPKVFVNSTHVTPPERQALADLRALGLTDVVPKPMKGPHPFTYWDYRAGAFAKDQGMRIDLVYASQAVAARVSGAFVDREARKGKGPSDHAPIVVDLD